MSRVRQHAVVDVDARSVQQNVRLLSLRVPNDDGRVRRIVVLTRGRPDLLAAVLQEDLVLVEGTFLRAVDRQTVHLGAGQHHGWLVLEHVSGVAKAAEGATAPRDFVLVLAGERAVADDDGAVLGTLRHVVPSQAVVVEYAVADTDIHP